MTDKQFWIQLTLVTGGTGLALFLLNNLPLFQTYQDLSLWSVILFVVISIVMFYIGRWGVEHSNKNIFTTLLFGFVAAKMFLSVVLLLVYHLFMEPANQFFILPFFLVYIVYTIFECVYLTKLNEGNSYAAIQRRKMEAE